MWFTAPEKTMLSFASSWVWFLYLNLSLKFSNYRKDGVRGWCYTNPSAELQPTEMVSTVRHSSIMKFVSVLIWGDKLEFWNVLQKRKAKNASGGNIRQISWNAAFQWGVKLCHGCQAASSSKVKNIFHPALLCSVLLSVQWEEKRTVGHEGGQQILGLNYSETFYHGTHQDRTLSEKHQNTYLYNAIYHVV